MELALYHPDRGYYASGRANIGRRGDFFTNVSVGSLFGRLLASQFAEIWEKLGRPRDFKIVEQGAHDGVFAADALSALRRSAGDCFAATSYCMIEPFPIWRERQQKNLREFAEKTSWVASVDEIAAKLSRGVILTIDYGFSRTEFYSLHRSQGSLQVRANQKKLSSPFQQIGLADISAHVEWTTLAEVAKSSGATPIGFTDQHHFLTGIISKSFPEADFDAAEKRALQTLLHPEMLGRNFQTLALGKDFRETLSGFHFARDPAARLGL